MEKEHDRQPSDASKSDAPVNKGRRRAIQGTAAGVLLAAPAMESLSGKGVLLRAAKADSHLEPTGFVDGEYQGPVIP